MGWDIRDKIIKFMENKGDLKKAILQIRSD